MNKKKIGTSLPPCWVSDPPQEKKKKLHPFLNSDFILISTTHLSSIETVDIRVWLTLLRWQKFLPFSKQNSQNCFCGSSHYIKSPGPHLAMMTHTETHKVTITDNAVATGKDVSDDCFVSISPHREGLPACCPDEHELCHLGPFDDDHPSSLQLSGTTEPSISRP